VGPGGLKAAVADAGPLIHLTEIGCLPLLQTFESLHIPDAVWLETVEQGQLTQANVLELSVVERHTLSQADVTWFIQADDLEDLHAGECECLYLCQQTGVPILLTDDLAVREAARRLNLTPIGSLGIVVKAYQLGNISLTDAERHISDLYDVSSLFVTRAIVELAVERLRQRSNLG
jgi:predicted nucleic acid-binding protein